MKHIVWNSGQISVISTLFLIDCGFIKQGVLLVSVYYFSHTDGFQALCKIFRFIDRFPSVSCFGLISSLVFSFRWKDWLTECSRLA